MDGPIVVVIPSYREAENIENIVLSVLNLGDEFHVLVVNDEVGDGTSDIVNQMRERNGDRVDLISRKGKGGRGSATLEGFQKAVEKTPRLIMEMDADFSHRPEDVYEVAKAADDYDIVIGSRYLSQSKILKWPIRRRIFSALANRSARLLLGVPVTDYTNGLRCYRRKVIEQMPFDLFECKGFIVLSETLCWAHWQGFSIGEVPILFVNRKRGVSSVTFAELTDSFLSLYKIRARKKVFARHRKAESTIRRETDS